MDGLNRITFSTKILPPGYNTAPVIYSLMTAKNSDLTIIKDVTVFAQLYLIRGEHLPITPS